MTLLQPLFIPYSCPKMTKLFTRIKAYEQSRRRKFLNSAVRKSIKVFERPKKKKAEAEGFGRRSRDHFSLAQAKVKTIFYGRFRRLEPSNGTVGPLITRHGYSCRAVSIVIHPLRFAHVPGFRRRHKTDSCHLPRRRASTVKTTT